MSNRRGISKPYFNINHYPMTYDCRVLDAQISDLRDKQDLVNRGEMWGNAKTVQDVLQGKEIQFAKLYCETKLADLEVYGTVDAVTDRFKEDEERILGELNKKRATYLVGGGVVLLIALAIFIK